MNPDVSMTAPVGSQRPVVSTGVAMAVLLERMREFPFFAPLSESVLKRLQPNITERNYAAGEPILRMGEYSDAVDHLAQGYSGYRQSRHRAR